MLKSDEITLAQSKRREKMAAIQKTDEINEEGRKELRSLTSAYEGAEVELRASLIQETAERDKIKDKEPDKAKVDFEAECRSYSISAMVEAQVDNKLLTGRELEVTQELETRHGAPIKGQRVPWAALEQRADAAITAATGAGGELVSKQTHNALERFFEGSTAERFGVSALQVSGSPSFPELTGGASVSWVADGVGADSEAITTATKTPTIKTATARYLLNRQAIRQNDALEMILRRDLAEVLREGIDKAVFQGTGADAQPTGLGVALTGANTAELAGTPSFSVLFSRAIQLMESAKLSEVGQIRIAAAPVVLETLEKSLVASTAVSELDRLKKAGMRIVFSSQVSAVAARNASAKAASNVFFAAGMNNAFVPVWGPGAELLVDPYSESKSGKLALTIFSFLDTVFQRTGTHAFKLSDVRDR